MFTSSRYLCLPVGATVDRQCAAGLSELFHSKQLPALCGNEADESKETKTVKLWAVQLQQQAERQ